MKRFTRVSLRCAAVILLMLLNCISPGFTQTRLNDKDIESVMKNLSEDAKKFRSTFNSAVGKSTIRKTSQEKEAKNLVAQFEKQTDGMLEQFKNKKKADLTLPAVQASGDQIDKLLVSTPMGDQANDAWAKIKTELTTLSQQFGNSK